MTILVCDDEREIVDAIEIYLLNEGYEVLKAYDGLQALDLLEQNEVHLVIMDIMMPHMDGIRATMRLRESGNIPVIMLSAKSEDGDKILGLNSGADDYLTKPFNPLELIARVKSQLRRFTSLGSMETVQGVISTGGLTLDDRKKTVTVDGEQVKLTPMEYKILRYLMQNMEMVLSTTQIYEHVWDERAVGAENTIAVHIRRIREKIEINPKDPKYLKVVWGIGYKIEKIKV
ncbi:response regulator transcription factor [Christensenellaceae bacterium OttesenSCG-928-K19]|nr:response regulator transcription factor [Christensenellaceae bacterium OttesenSCG-928-K19]